MRSLKEFLIEMLSKTQLFEMAYNRKDFIRTCDNFHKQIVENWCLVKYCNLYDKQNLNLNHWKYELYSHCDNLYRMQIDSDKYKAIKHSFIKNNELDDYKTVELTTCKKFEYEGIETNSKYREVVEMFIEYGVEKIMRLISNKKSNINTNLLYSYIFEDI